MTNEINALLDAAETLMRRVLHDQRCICWTADAAWNGQHDADCSWELAGDVFGELAAIVDDDPTTWCARVNEMKR